MGKRRKSWFPGSNVSCHKQANRIIDKLFHRAFVEAFNQHGTSEHVPF